MKHGETYVLAITEAELECVHRAVMAACGAAPVEPTPGRDEFGGYYGRGWFVQMDDDLNRLRRNLIPESQRT